MSSKYQNLKSIVMEGSVDEITACIKSTMNVNTVDFDGFTLLHWAARKRDLGLVKTLVELKADINTQSNENITPLHFAIKYDHQDQNSLEIVEYLIENEAEIDAKDQLGSTPLHWALYGNLIDVIKLLTESGANVNEKNNIGSTPLHWAETGEAVEILYEHGADVNAKDENGATPLHRLNSNCAIQKLLEYGCNVNAKDNDGLTPLHKANDLDMIQTLIEFNADISAKDNSGMTPIQRAMADELEDVVEILTRNSEEKIHYDFESDNKEYTETEEIFKIAKKLNVDEKNIIISDVGIFKIIEYLINENRMLKSELYKSKLSFN